MLMTDHGSNHVVYEAMLEGRHVALKEYRTDPRSLQRVYKEASVLRRLSTAPGIVKIEAIFRHENYLYLQMPFYEMGTLRQWVLREQPDDTAFGTAIYLVLEALVHLHGHKICHLDIKPENILMCENSRPHVADYDISLEDTATRVRAKQTNVTRIGTDGFIAPEVETNPLDASPAADMFSLDSPKTLTTASSRFWKAPDRACEDDTSSIAASIAVSAI